MNFNVGDIIRCKSAMIITDLNDKDETVDKGQYFIIVSRSEEHTSELQSH